MKMYKNKVAIIALLSLGLLLCPGRSMADNGGDDANGGGSHHNGSHNDSDDDVNELVVVGPISAIDAVSVTVNSIAYQITVNTELESGENEHAAVSDFAVNDIVKIEYFVDGANNIAKEIEKEHDSSDGEDVGGHHQEHVNCDFSNLSLVTKRLEQTLRGQVNTATFKNVRVRVHGRRAGKAQKLGSAPGILNGLTVSKNSDDSGLALKVSGSLDNLQECEAEFSMKVNSQATNKQTGNRIRRATNSTLSVKGVLNK